MFYPIQLDKMRNFRYGMKAISLVEKKFGQAVSEINMSALTMEELAIFMWAGLCHEDETLTTDKVMELIDEYSDIKTVSAIMGESIAGAFNGGKTDGDELKNAIKAVTKKPPKSLQ